MGLSVSHKAEPDEEIRQLFGWTPSMVRRAAIRAHKLAPNGRLTRATFYEAFMDYSVVRGNSFVNLNQTAYSFLAASGSNLCTRCETKQDASRTDEVIALPGVDARIVLFFLALSCDTTPETQVCLFQDIFELFGGSGDPECWKCHKLLSAVVASPTSSLADGHATASDGSLDDNGSENPPALDESKAAAPSSEATIEYAKASESDGDGDDGHTISLKQWTDLIMWMLRSAHAVGILRRLPEYATIGAITRQAADELDDTTLNEEQVRNCCTHE